MRLSSSLLCVFAFTMWFAGCGRNNASPTSPPNTSPEDMSSDMSSGDMSSLTCDAGGALCHTTACRDSPACQDREVAAYCGEDERVQQGRCVPCDVGMINAADDDATGPDTACEPLLCGAQERVLANACASCEGDLQNLAGDDASGEDTLCDGMNCPSDHHVVDAQCVPCEIGTTRAAGDDTAAGETACEPVVCGADTFARAHRCMPCPTGATNAAGDLASGEDTLCDDACSPYIDLHCSEYSQRAIKSAAPQLSDLQSDYGGFGDAIAIEGDLLLVGHPRDASDPALADPTDRSSDENGAAYLYVRDAMGAWREEAFIKPDDASAYKHFGQSVALDGNILAVGAPGEMVGSRINQGAVYLFEWTEADGVRFKEKVSWDDGKAFEFFGRSIAMEEGVLAVGMPTQENQAGEAAVGLVHLFSPNVQGLYGLSRTLRGAEQGEFFGASLEMDGDRLLVSTAAQRAHLFQKDELGDWAIAHTFTPWDAFGANFGEVASLHGDAIAIGASSASGSDPALAPRGAGAVYLFEYSGEQWRPLQKLAADHPGRLDAFGSALSLSHGQLAVSALYEASAGRGLAADPSDDSLEGAGAVYLFEPSADGWHQIAYIKAPHPDSEDAFGASIALDDGQLAVGVPGDDSSNGGVGADLDDDARPDSGAVLIHRIKP